VHNGMINKRPALIARCRTIPDIADAVNIGREQATEISVRGGGHSVAGLAVTDGGLMIDLAPMKGIRVDPARRTIWAQGGVTWKELNRAAACHGLATTGGVVSTTGIAEAPNRKQGHSRVPESAVGQTDQPDLRIFADQHQEWTGLVWGVGGGSALGGADRIGGRSRRVRSAVEHLREPLGAGVVV